MELHLSPLSRPRKFRRLVIDFAGFIGVCIFLRFWCLHQQDLNIALSVKEEVPIISKAFVVASRQGEDVSWIHEYLEEWEVFRYVTDNSTEVEYSVPANKGREAMVYLT